jgi:hypothetical protein
MKNTKFRNLCLCSEDHCWLLAVKVMKCTHNDPWRWLTFTPTEHLWKSVSQHVFHYSIQLRTEHFCCNKYLKKYEWIDTEIRAYCHVMCSSFWTTGMSQQIWVKLFLIVNGDENLFISFQVTLCMQMDREQFQQASAG